MLNLAQPFPRCQAPPRKLLYDLFCGGGGVARCALALGWHVVGVDIKPQPNYPGEFVLADALHPPLKPIADLVWASPPCQGYSKMTYLKPQTALPKLVPQVRQAARFLGRHYVIENVQPCDDLINPTRLCGQMFGLPLIRHRLFECSFPLPQLRHMTHSRRFYQVCGHCKGSLQDWSRAMGLSGMTKSELAQSVPWAYTWYILMWHEAWR